MIALIVLALAAGALVAGLNTLVRRRQADAQRAWAESMTWEVRDDALFRDTTTRRAA